MTHTLIHDHVSQDTVEAFDHLLKAAKDGQIVGVVFGVALRRGRYYVDCSGSLARDPTLGRGVVAALDDYLGAMVHRKLDQATSR